MSTAKDTWYLLGGTCHKSARGTEVCGEPSGVHKPWRKANGDLVKIHATLDTEIIATAMIAWHGSHDTVQQALTEIGEVTMSQTDAQGSGSLRYVVRYRHGWWWV